MCSPQASTAQRLAALVDASPRLQCVGAADGGADTVSQTRTTGARLVVLDAGERGDSALRVAQSLTRIGARVLLLVRDEERAAIEARADDRRDSIRVASRGLALRGERSSEALLRTKLHLMGARILDRPTPVRSALADGDVPGGGVAVPPSAVDLLDREHDAVVLVGSAGTPHLLPQLLATPGAARLPLVVAVHHNGRFADGFTEWVGTLLSESPRRFDVDAVVAARGFGALFVAPPEPGGDALVGPDLGGLLATLASRGMRLLVCIASGMGDPVVEGLRQVGGAGGTVLALCPERCPQPAMVLAARNAGLVAVELDVPAMAWTIAAARGILARPVVA